MLLEDKSRYRRFVKSGSFFPIPHVPVVSVKLFPVTTKLVKLVRRESNALISNNVHDKSSDRNVSGHVVTDNPDASKVVKVVGRYLKTASLVEVRDKYSRRSSKLCHVLSLKSRNFIFRNGYQTEVREVYCEHTM